MRFILALFACSFFATSVYAAEPAASAAEQHTTQLTHQAEVIDVIDAGVYTYIKVSEKKESFWLAALTMAVKKGDVIRFNEGPAVTDFYSKSLKRNFNKVVFISRGVIDK